MVTTNMRPIRETIGLNEALALINEATKPLERSERAVSYTHLRAHET